MIGPTNRCNSTIDCLLVFLDSVTMPRHQTGTSGRTVISFCFVFLYSQRWWSKWHHEYPEWRDEHYRFDSQFPVMRRTTFNAGVTKPAYKASLDKPEWRQDYHRQGSTVSETVRALSLNRAHWTRRNPDTYQFTNAMTSTQYQRPVTTVYGPLLRGEVYGVPTQHNRHGFMPAHDFP